VETDVWTTGIVVGVDVADCAAATFANCGTLHPDRTVSDTKSTATSHRFVFFIFAPR
jgi:hypothetical protein